MAAGSKLPSTTPRARSSATTGAPPSSAPGRSPSQIASVRTGRPASRRSTVAPRCTTVSRSSSPSGPVPRARRRPAGSSPAAASAVAKRLPVSSPNAARARSSAPLRRSSSPSGPSNEGSGATGTARTSAATSQGWSVTTRSCMRSGLLWARWRDGRRAAGDSPQSIDPGGVAPGGGVALEPAPGRRPGRRGRRGRLGPGDGLAVDPGGAAGAAAFAWASRSSPRDSSIVITAWFSPPGPRRPG